MIRFDRVFKRYPNGREALSELSFELGEKDAAEAIHHLPDCTHCHPELYHSYRREGYGSGRMISFVGFRL